MQPNQQGSLKSRMPRPIILLVGLAIIVNVVFMRFSTYFPPSNFGTSNITVLKDKESLDVPSFVNDASGGERRGSNYKDATVDLSKEQLIKENLQLRKQLRSALKKRPAEKSSAERLAPYVNKYYVSPQENAKGGNEWSFDKLEREYKEQLAKATYYVGDGGDDKNLLFIDSREQCEAHRKFLISVRQSGFKGNIVLLVYYEEDEADCQPLANAFQPMIVFYRYTPLMEPTLAMYHGIVNYARAFPQHLKRGTYNKVVLVKPDAVFWCNRTNPFNDIPSKGHEDNLYAVVGRQSDIITYQVKDRNASSPECFGPSGRPTETDERLKNNVLVDAFIGTTSLTGLVKFATMLVEAHSKQDFDEPYSPYDFIKNYLKGKDHISVHLRERLVQMQPAARYVAAICTQYLPADGSCLNCDKATVVVGTTFCVRKVTYEVPNYTPYCFQPYRHAILEVPHTMTMRTHARDNIIKGAHGIRDRPEGIFAEPANASRAVSEQCPDGAMGVLTMMAGYTVKRVHRFIGSFIAHANPKCTKLIMMVKRDMNFESVLKHFPHHVELVYLGNNSEWSPVRMKDCKPADSRFEVAQLWLEKNYHRFRYLMATDSRDYVWLADPYAQLIRILKQQNYDEDEFVGSVAEPYVAGAATYPSGSVSRFLRRWILSCGEHCFRKISHMKFTNGEPFAVLNSGHVIGTTLGMLHYYRFHVRMMADSGHRCDGTDQGLFTYYLYGMLQEAHYPHKVFVFSSSRSGFANMPSPSRMAKRVNTTTGKTEYTITDCNNNIFAGLHQFDRHGAEYRLLLDSPQTMAPWKPFIDTKTFDSEFHD